MADDKTRSGLDDAGGLEALLMSRSFTDVELAEATESSPDHRILPDASVVKIGGQSLIDRGRAAMAPIVDELVEIRKDHQIMIGTGAGTRARHLYALAADLGLPTGVLTDIGTAVAGQNAVILGHLMARYGIPRRGRVGLQRPLLLSRGAACGHLPRHAPLRHVAARPRRGAHPSPYRTDAGCYLVAEV